MFRFLQNYPLMLEWIFEITQSVLGIFRRWLKPGGNVEKIFIRGEEITKAAIFDCRMCGQCILHSTGMTCPMTCPKNLRNGPCGGVRANCHCEIIPEMPCVWVQAWERSRHMARYGDDILHVMPPVNRQLEGTSAWINDYSGQALKVPAGWDA